MWVLLPPRFPWKKRCCLSQKKHPKIEKAFEKKNGLWGPESWIYIQLLWEPQKEALWLDQLPDENRHQIDPKLSDQLISFHTHLEVTLFFV